MSGLEYQDVRDAVRATVTSHYATRSSRLEYMLDRN